MCAHESRITEVDIYTMCFVGAAMRKWLPNAHLSSLISPSLLALSLLSPLFPLSLSPLTFSLLSLHQVLTSQDLVFMAAQISRGMYHLARKGVTHRDLAARNI